jgi:hypothetical protein
VKAGGAALLYGDVIQLQHLDSGRFIGMQKAHAVVNHNNKSVILLEEEQEGDSCFFKVKSIHIYKCLSHIEITPQQSHNIHIMVCFIYIHSLRCFPGLRFGP